MPSKVRLSQLTRKLNNEYIQLPANLGARIYSTGPFTVLNPSPGIPLPPNIGVDWHPFIFTNSEWYDTGSTGTVATTYPNGMFDFAVSPSYIEVVHRGFYSISASMVFQTVVAPAGFYVGVAIATTGALYGGAPYPGVIVHRMDIREILSNTFDMPCQVHDTLYLKAGERVYMLYYNFGPSPACIHYPDLSPSLSVTRIP